MKKLIYILIVTVSTSLFLSGCLKDDNLEELKKQEQLKLQQYIQVHKYTETPKDDGLYVIISDSGKGNTAIAGDFALVNYSMYLIDNTLLETNDAALAAKNNLYPVSTVPGPIMLQVGNTFIRGFSEGLMFLKDSSKAKLIVPSNLALGSYYSSLIPSYSTLVYNVELVQIVKDPIARDRANINRWVDSLQMQVADTLEDGVYLKIDSAGTGNLATSSNTIYAEYKLWLVDNRTITSKYTAINFKPNDDSMIPGFNLALSKLQKGAYARIIIPYYEAYGAGGRNNDYNQKAIPIFTSLVYDIHVTNIQ